jgi:hypothetical protein
MYDSALAAAHRAEEKRLARLLHLVASRLRGQPQFLNAQKPVIVSVEHD